MKYSSSLFAESLQWEIAQKGLIWRNTNGICGWVRLTGLHATQHNTIPTQPKQLALAKQHSPRSSNLFSFKNPCRVSTDRTNFLRKLQSTEISRYRRRKVKSENSAGNFFLHEILCNTVSPTAFLSSDVRAELHGQMHQSAAQELSQARARQCGGVVGTMKAEMHQFHLKH
jgi:hypothetical protein